MNGTGRERHDLHSSTGRPLGRRATLLVALAMATLGASTVVPAASALAAEVAPTILATPPPTGTVSGTIVVTGAPQGFTPAYAGVGGCHGKVTSPCGSPQYALTSGTTYTIQLRVGTWRMEGFYELAPYGGAFLGSVAIVKVAAGKTSTANFTVPYKAPGTVEGTVSVTKVPPGVTVSSVSALACPSYAPYTGGANRPLECAEAFGGQSSDTYSIATLPPGPWILYPAYSTQFGQSVSAKGTDVTIVSGTTKTVNLTTPYLTPGSGVVSGTATVTGAPSGFSDPVLVVACKGSTFSLTCPKSQITEVSGTAYQLSLSTGAWTVAALYQPQPYGGLQVGPPATVRVSAGKTTDQALSVPYNTPGTVGGRISVTGLPDNLALLTVTVLACPIGSPYTGNPANPECAGEWSSAGSAGVGGRGLRFTTSSRIDATPGGTGGASAPYAMSLPSGEWLLYPGYSTIYGPMVSTTGTPVTIVANTSVTEALTAPYQVPTDGALTGTVRLFDAPVGAPGIFGVEACPSPPPTQPGTVCEDSTSRIAANGTYQLSVPSGNWWVAEAYWYEVGSQGGTTYEPLAGPSKEVTVTAGSTMVINLSAVYGAT